MTPFEQEQVASTSTAKSTANSMPSKHSAETAKYTFAKSFVTSTTGPAVALGIRRCAGLVAVGAGFVGDGNMDIGSRLGMTNDVTVVMDMASDRQVNRGHAG